MNTAQIFPSRDSILASNYSPYTLNGMMTQNEKNLMCDMEPNYNKMECPSNDSLETSSINDEEEINQIYMMRDNDVIYRPDYNENKSGYRDTSYFKHSRIRVLNKKTKRKIKNGKKENIILNQEMEISEVGKNIEVDVSANISSEFSTGENNSSISATEDPVSFMRVHFPKLFPPENKYPPEPFKHREIKSNVSYFVLIDSFEEKRDRPKKVWINPTNKQADRMY